MGDMADDARDTEETLRRHIVSIKLGLRAKCRRKGCTDPEVKFNDNGLFECLRCGKEIDL